MYEDNMLRICGRQVRKWPDLFQVGFYTRTTISIPVFRLSVKVDTSVNNPPSTSSGNTKKGKNQTHTNETFIIGHNLQPSTSPRTDQSGPEKIDAGNLQITVQQNKNDMAITIGKKEKTKQDKNVKVEDTTHQDEKTQPKKNTPAFTRKNASRKKSPSKK
ncbi:Uncharacterized protein FWK35_00014959 [Aphis craccivora]|uniref:Uncharacterized protein n=1 Tax=Aphis craccivora TaxID=307492 RepID=A0A6G0YL07_APHCR|nr:Uncharacterized protein FWK35_00014959 [Aphis craccivora]